ncbi:MAG: efflux RND transporter periplasmic adaptor subunit [Bacteroidetes bacterium]|nr:efflux RND transporter periplasmic adaptor subunit [Bacteroidota bacterium]
MSESLGVALARTYARFCFYWVWGILWGMMSACTHNTTKEIHPTRRDITEYVFATGVLDTDERYSLVAQADGYLTSVHFKENDVVKPAQLLAVIDNKANVSNAQAAAEQLTITSFNMSSNAPALRQMQSNVEFAEKKYQQDLTQQVRLGKLLETNSIAGLEYDNAVLATQNSLSSLNALKEQYKHLQQQAQMQNIAQKNLYEVSKTNENYNQLRAIVGGTVLKRYKQTGDFIRKGDVLAIIGQTNTILAKVNVDENSISKVKVGQKAFVKLNPYEEKRYEGQVSEILPMFEEATQSFVCKIVFISPLDFRISGTQLEVNIEVAQRENVLVVPRSYVGFGNVVNIKGRDQEQVIRPGIISNEYVEVVVGLTENDLLLPLKPR